MFARIAITVAAIVAGTITSVSPAAAGVVQLEGADKPGKPAELSYVEPYRIRAGVPTRLFVEMADGSAYRFTPCRYEDSPDCFWWAPGRGNNRGRSFIDLGGRVIYL